MYYKMVLKWNYDKLYNQFIYLFQISKSKSVLKDFPIVRFLHPKNKPIVNRYQKYPQYFTLYHDFSHNLACKVMSELSQNRLHKIQAIFALLLDSKTVGQTWKNIFQAIIVLLLIGLVLTIPVAVLVFLYNLKSGFRAVEIDDDEEGDLLNFVESALSKLNSTKRHFIKICLFQN